MDNIKYAVCWDECGNEIHIECPVDESSHDIITTFPEYKFRYFKEEDQDKYYDNDQDCDYYDFGDGDY
tara:strand:- start:1095 stop:1298 length:204 start_codon:yes stop_codon:yes gene_type:complete